MLKINVRPEESINRSNPYERLLRSVIKKNSKRLSSQARCHRG